MSVECKKILVPTFRDKAEMDAYADEIKKFCPDDVSVFCSCVKASASINRNMCLDKLEIGEVAIMLDDDMAGFYSGWIDDLTYSMTDESVAAVSARLMRPDGRLGETCTRCFELTPEEIEVKSNGTCTLPTAAIAFRHKGIRYWEELIGSGFEDNDYFLEYSKAFPGSKWVQSNRCRLIHKNFMVNQKGKFWDHNLALFEKKWGKR